MLFLGKGTGVISSVVMVRLPYKQRFKRKRSVLQTYEWFMSQSEIVSCQCLAILCDARI